MFDNYLIRGDSLCNVVGPSGILGIRMAVRLANYRGCYLSLHAGYFIEIDAVHYPVEKQRLEINGQPPRRFDELRSAVHEHWDFDDEAFLHIALPGGLTAGTHVVRFQQCVLAAYGYLPTDEQWVRQAPTPGAGAGSDKTPEIVTFKLQLQGVVNAIPS